VSLMLRQQGFATVTMDAGDGPARIGRYEIQAPLGRGAMGSVYKARDPHLDRVVAIKMVRTDLGCPPEHLAEYKRRFYQEAMAAGRLSHPNIVAVHDVMEVDRTPYIVMEYVESDTLADVIRARGALSDTQAVDLVLQVCRALEYAHAHGIVHRDIKPANILVSKRGQVKVSDFGIARIDGQDLTQSQVRLGTPAYMSPEQIRGQLVDGRSDLFSLGAVLYEALTGEKPFRRTDTATLFESILNDTPPLLHERNPLLQQGLSAVVARALAKDREQRFLDARMFADALSQLIPVPRHDGAAALHHSQRPARPLRLARHRLTRVGAACVLLAVAGGLALASLGPRMRGDQAPAHLAARETVNPRLIDTPRPGPPATNIAPEPGPAPLEAPTADAQTPREHGGQTVPAPASSPKRPSPDPVARMRPTPPSGLPASPLDHTSPTVHSGSLTAPPKAVPGESRPEPEPWLVTKILPPPTPEPPPVRPPRSTTPPIAGNLSTPPFASSVDILGRWQGHYQCQRDRIGFTLDITHANGNRVDAIFQFFPLPGTLSFDSGSFRMSGEHDRADGSVRLQRAAWIKRPMGFQAHDLEGHLDEAGATINGRVLTSGCAHFVLTRR
jgi:eukaryotic-like serine/threonine-protein kinase